MQTTQLLTKLLISSCIAFAFFSIGCSSNDYDTSTEKTTVSPSHDVHMNPADADHPMMDSTHMMGDSTMMHDTMMHKQH